MIRELSPNIVLVTGSCNSAVFDLENSRFATFDRASLDVLTRAATRQRLSAEEQASVEKFKHDFGIQDLTYEPYVFPKPEPVNLRFAQLEVTQKCSYHCDHCYEGTSHKEVENPVSFQRWLEIIDEVRMQGCERIQFIGGEPTLYKHLTPLIVFAASRGIKRLEVFSNLYNISDDLITILEASHVLVRTSFYGANSQTHDRVTGVRGSFARTCQNVTRLIEEGVAIAANVVLTPDNRADKENIIAAVRALGLHNIHVDNVREVKGCSTTNNYPKIEKPFSNFRITKQFFDQARYGLKCLCGSLYITADGNVFPCSMERSVCYGNAVTSSIEDIITSQTVKETWGLSMDDIEVCAQCEFRYICVDCRAKASANGNIHSKNPACPYNPLRGEYVAY